MQKVISLKLLPSEAVSHGIINQKIADSTGYNISVVTGFFLLKKSIDARGRQPWVNITVQAFINEPFINREVVKIPFKEAGKAPQRVVIIGAGPAGLFAALKLIENGIQPIILERGKNVRDRRRDLAILNKKGVVNPESNYCFGEGGAGTYSDGKLYTRSNKRGDINRILNLFVQFGAEEQILYESHPHIGTNKLPQIITAMRQAITDHGGQFLFEKKVIDFVIKETRISAVKTADGDTYQADAFILATGHSARDIFTLLHDKKILIETKPFALGVRVEHPQSIIDHSQYHTTLPFINKKNDVKQNFLNDSKPEGLPPASYSLVHQAGENGVFSFCMCPGGIIAPASTNAGELVVNGWSPSKRNNPFANSGMVVTCDRKNIAGLSSYQAYIKTKNSNIESPLAMMHFQDMVERYSFEGGGGNMVAPAQRMVDFCNNIISSTLPVCSYLPGIGTNELSTILPLFIYKSLQEAFIVFGKKMKSFYTNEAVVVATESRTSSPVKIPRDSLTLNHPQIENLYPCGEGAGYAGGIVSAAMDGERVATVIAQKMMKQ